MKYVNFYNATAAVIISTLVITMAQATGEFAPPLIVGALFLTVLVMGWAGAASDARAEVDRLKCIMYGQNTEARLRAAEVVKRGAEIVRQRRLITSIQEDNSSWREGCNEQIRRIGELTGANGIAEARIAELEAANALLVGLHTAVVEHAAMFEETSDEYNMSALSIQQALDALQADQAEPAPAPQSRPQSEDGPGPAQNQGQATIPAGWQLVPIEPTPAMIAAAQFHAEHNSCGDEDGGEVEPGGQQFYRARGQALAVYFEMLRAAPPAPQSQPQAVDGAAPATAWPDILALQPLVEPVSISKAMLAHREARAVLSGGSGPVAAVHLVNIGLTGWTHNEATATAYAAGWNAGVKTLRKVLADAAALKNKTAEEGGA